MSKWKEGDRVRVIGRAVTEDDRKANVYYSHMAGLTGTVEFLYEGAMIGVKVDPTTISGESASVHREATERMRAKINEEQRKSLEPEEINFPVNFSLLVRAADIEKV